MDVSILESLLQVILIAVTHKTPGNLKNLKHQKNT